MREQMKILLAMVLAATATAQPARAATPPAATEAPVGSTVIVIDVDRVWVVERLIRLGQPPADAWVQAMHLTDADVAVLAANPRMVQRGGAMLSDSLVLGLLLIAGLIALAYWGDGSISIN